MRDGGTGDGARRRRGGRTTMTVRPKTHSANTEINGGDQPRSEDSNELSVSELTLASDSNDPMYRTDEDDSYDSDETLVYDDVMMSASQRQLTENKTK